MTRKDPAVAETTKIDRLQSGGMIKRTVRRKGLLNEIEIDTDGAPEYVTPPSDEIAVARLKEMKESARRVLADAGLPDYAAAPFKNLSIDRELKKPDDERPFLQPLSKEEQAARLIEAIDEVFELGSERAAWTALQFGVALHHYLVAGPINERVVAAALAEEIRSKGPQAKSAAKTKREDLVLAVANEFWEKNARHRSNASRTADAILDAVNAELQRRGLSAVEKKTIAADIRSKTKFSRLAIRRN